ncbi:hypothetical protein [Streptococcus cuniculi]|uniref:hypothetical protein n=1 Tax=Streptococcus cuniculi TaxID=1432788 RepID=UPI0018845E7F|nr:hypothetical protein [Streptococcus cuniculi]MBF0777447.1 hypothetical protein [Streptococcus cuniculi]
MSNLVTFDNIYANLAQSTYNGRPNLFVYKKLSKKQQNRLLSGQSISINYSQDAPITDENDNIIGTVRGGRQLPNDGVVYLQPDSTYVVEQTTTVQVPKVNGGYETQVVTGKYQKSLLTDKKAGFNAYFLTDTPTLTQDTKNTYLAIRGSDAPHR